MKRKDEKMGIRLFLYFYLFGYYEVKVKECQKARALNYFLRHGISAYPMDALTFRIASRYKKLLDEAKEVSLHLSLGEKKGIFAFVKKHRFRLGIPVGVLLSFVFLKQHNY